MNGSERARSFCVFMLVYFIPGWAIRIELAV
ncbi:MAG: hypothetical protein ACI9NT_001289 [Bacteroidia bacterium]|jgi:hypothetical protein